MNHLVLVCIGLCTGLVSLVIYGIDFSMWRFYGLTYSEYLIRENTFAVNSEAFIQMRNNMGPVLRYFHTLTLPIYEIPLNYLIASVLLKALVFLVLYFLLKALEMRTPILLSLIIIFSGSAFAQTGGTLFFVGGPSFLKAGISGLLCVLGLITALRNSVLLSALLFGLSFQFHLFNGLGALVFSIPIVFATNGQKIPKSKWALAIVILGLSLVGFGSSGFQSAGSVPLISLEDWFLLVKKINDTYLIDHLIYTLPNVVAFLAVTIFLTPENESDHWKKISGGIYWSLALIPIFIFIDHLHDRNIYFGKLSEIYAAVEMRRGIWVPTLLLYILGWKRIIDEQKRSPDKVAIIALGVAYLVAGLVWSFAGTLILATLLFVSAPRSMKTSTRILWICSIVVSGIATLAFQNSFSFGSFAGQVLKFAILSCLAVFLAKRIRREWVTLALVLLIPLSKVRNILSEDLGLRRDVSLLKNFGPGLKGTLTIEDLMRIGSQMKNPVAIGDDPLRGQFRHDMEKAVNEVNSDHALVWTPITLEPAVTKSPIFFDPFWNYFTTIYSRVSASKYESLIFELYGVRIRNVFGDVDGDTYGEKNLEPIHNSLSENHVLEVMEKNKIGILVSKAEYSKLKLLRQIQDYKIYSTLK